MATKLSLWTPATPETEFFLRLSPYTTNEVALDLVDKSGTRITSGSVGIFHLDSNGKLNFRRSGGVNTAHVAVDTNGMIKTN